VEKLLKPQQLSDLLQVKLSTVYKWVHYGYIPFVKIGGLVRFREAKVEAWLEKRAKKGRYSYKFDIN
jgi:excisionase family DNA binding protein